jgi:hypothetical protein
MGLPGQSIALRTREYVLHFLVISICSWATIGIRAGEPTARTNGSQAVSSVSPGHHYPKPTLAETLVTRNLALALAEKTRVTIVPTMHLVETDHFLIFSAWNPSNDALLADLAERMFQLLCQQFNVPPTESVWIGKCPIYLFWEPSHYERFISEIDDSRSMDSNMAHANGFHASRGVFSYIVINGVSKFGPTLELAKIEFYHVLVHEGTHAFLERYISRQPLPLWVEEGLADFISATLVPQSEVNRKYITASVSAARKPETLQKVLEKKKDLTSGEYGLAQSLIRFLIQTDRNALVRFLEQMKDGEDEDAALASAYHGTRAELVRSWAAFWQRPR